MAENWQQTIDAFDREIDRLERHHDQLVYDKIPKLETKLALAQIKADYIGRMLIKMREYRTRARRRAERETSSS